MVNKPNCRPVKNKEERFVMHDSTLIVGRRGCAAPGSPLNLEETTHKLRCNIGLLMSEH
ncbi:hypothetical protein J6590_095236, partial [Homalodisca vitripennis]